MEYILVTGGAGYIGSHCCKALAEAGFRLVVYDNLSTGHPEFARWGRLIEGDVRDGDRLAKTLHEIRPMAVLHLAGVALVGNSVVDPELYYDVNVVGGLKLLQSMRAAGVDRIVFSSTCAVYGNPDVLPINEGARERPVNAYGASKLAFERMLADFGAAYGFRSVRLRYFNAAGADPGGELGEWHENETHLIPSLILASLGRRPPVPIFGTDYETPDGTAIRDYVHVSDLAGAHVAALKHLAGHGTSEVLNLGSGKGISVREVVETVGQVTGLTVPIALAARRAGDPPCLVADVTRANAVLGWRPENADLSLMVGDAWRWHSAQIS